VICFLPLPSKGQALQFNWLFEKEAFVMHSDGRFSVDFDKVRPLTFSFFSSSCLLCFCECSDPFPFLIERLKMQLKV